MTDASCPRLPELPAADADLLALARPDGWPADAPGLFAASGWLRRVSQESGALMGGPCALLLEVAHPFVALGVSQHSHYRTDPYGRLRRTLDAVNAIAFGDLTSALAAARGIERAHARVRGRLPEAAGRFPAGTPYDGRDPGAARWVWATLAHTALAVYERMVGPLAAPQRDAYFAEHAVMGRVLGVPADQVPGDAASFERYFAGMLDGDELAVTPEARDIADSILDPPPGTAPRPPGTVVLLTAGLLPERLRTGFQLDWDADRAERLEAFCAEVRALRPNPEGAARPDLDAAGAAR